MKPCILKTSHNILMGNGMYTPIHKLGKNDEVLNAYGSRVKIDQIYHTRQSITLYEIKPRRALHKVEIPSQNFIHTLSSSWKNVDDLYSLMKNEKYENHENHKIHEILISPFHYPDFLTLSVNKEEHVLSEFPPYQLGFVIGSFICCGSTFNSEDFQARLSPDKSRHLHFFCDKDAYIKKLERYLKTSFTTFASTQIRIFEENNSNKGRRPSRVILEARDKVPLLPLFIEIERCRDISILSTVYRFLGPNNKIHFFQGIYEGMIQSSHHFSTPKTYEIVLYLETCLVNHQGACFDYLLKRGQILEIEKKGKKPENEEQKVDISYITTKLDDVQVNKQMNNQIKEHTSLVCETIPTLSKYDP